MSQKDFATIMASALSIERKQAAINAMAAGNLTVEQAITLQGAGPPKVNGKAKPAAAAAALTASDQALLDIIHAQAGIDKTTGKKRDMAVAKAVFGALHSIGMTKERALAVVDDAYNRRVVSKRFPKTAKGQVICLLGDARVVAWMEAPKSVALPDDVTARAKSAFGL